MTEKMEGKVLRHPPLYFHGVYGTICADCTATALLMTTLPMSKFNWGRSILYLTVKKRNSKLGDYIFNTLGG